VDTQQKTRFRGLIAHHIGQEGYAAFLSVFSGLLTSARWRSVTVDFTLSDHASFKESSAFADPLETSSNVSIQPSGTKIFDIGNPSIG